jgi:hypothetical protein
MDLGDRWRTNIDKIFIQSGKAPEFSLNGKMLRAAKSERVPILEVAFPERQYLIAKSPDEWLAGRKELKPSKIGLGPMDFYHHEVDYYFPREGKHKDLYQSPDQLGLF